MQTLMQRVRREYLAWPGLSLTLRQSMRLWDAEPEVCRSALQALVRSRFLRQRADGRFVRADMAGAHGPAIADVAGVRPLPPSASVA